MALFLAAEFTEASAGPIVLRTKLCEAIVTALQQAPEGAARKNCAVAVAKLARDPAVRALPSRYRHDRIAFGLAQSSWGKSHHTLSHTITDSRYCCSRAWNAAYSVCERSAVPESGSWVA